MLSKFFSLYTRGEKLAIVSALILAIVFGFFWRRDVKKNYIETPLPGGVYREGIVYKPNGGLDLGRLTFAGLTRLSEKGEVVGDIAEKFEEKEGGKKYSFYLQEPFKAPELLETIENHPQTFAGATPNIIDEKTLEFSLKQPFAPFLAMTTDPIFPYGPFEIKKKEEKEILLLPRENYHLGKPYLEKITLRLYPDENALETGFKKEEFEGSIYFRTAKEGLAKYELDFPRYPSIIINLRRVPFQDKNLRTKIIEGGEINRKDLLVTLISPNTDFYLQKGQALKEKLEKQGVTVNWIKKDPLTLVKENIKPRDFDVLLYGLDYGVDPDPYPFWHSSQKDDPGLNLAGLDIKKIDKILEEGRTTLNKEERQKKYEEFKKLLGEEKVLLQLEQEKTNYQLPQKIKGVKTGFVVGPFDRFQNVNEWYIKSKKVPEK